MLYGGHRTVPTHDQILVPETLLKKRKSQEKQREQRSAELAKKRKVGSSFLCNGCG
jgi:large subunit ribosomal protein L7e